MFFEIYKCEIKKKKFICFLLYFLIELSIKIFYCLLGYKIINYESMIWNIFVVLEMIFDILLFKICYKNKFYYKIYFVNNLNFYFL